MNIFNQQSDPLLSTQAQNSQSQTQTSQAVVDDDDVDDDNSGNFTSLPNWISTPRVWKELKEKNSISQPPNAQNNEVCNKRYFVRIVINSRINSFFSQIIQIFNLLKRLYGLQLMI